MTLRRISERLPRRPHPPAERSPLRSPLPSPGIRPNDAGEAVSWPVRVTAAWSWRLIVIGTAVYFVLTALSRVTLLVYSLLVALLLAALLEPSVTRLRDLGMRRGNAAALVFVGGIATVGAILTVLFSALTAEAPVIADQAVDGVEEVQRWLVTGPLGMDQADIDRYVIEIQLWFDENTGRLTSGALGAAGAVGTFAGGVALTLFATFFFLYDGERIWDWVVRLFPRTAERTVDEAGDKAWLTLVGYVRGVVVVAAIDALGILLVLLVLRVPLAVPLAILVFFGAFVPLVGALLSGVIAVLVALVSQGPFTALFVAAGVVAVQQIEGNLLQPLIMSRFVTLHPLAIAMAVTAGAIIAGIGGAVVAVPVTAVTAVVLGHVATKSSAIAPPSVAAPLAPPGPSPSEQESADDS